MVALLLILAQGEAGYALDYWGGEESTSPHTGSFPGPPLWNCPDALCQVSPQTNLLSSKTASQEKGKCFREPWRLGFEPKTLSRVGVMVLPFVSCSL